MESFTIVQRAILMAILFLLLAIAGVSCVFLLVYCGSFTLAFVCTKIILNKKSHFNTQWLVNFVRAIAFMKCSIQKMFAQVVESKPNGSPNDPPTSSATAQCQLRAHNIHKQRLTSPRSRGKLVPKPDSGVPYAERMNVGILVSDGKLLPDQQHDDDKLQSTKATPNQNTDIADSITESDTLNPISHTPKISEKVQAEINDIITFIIRDFVHTWYDELSNNSETIQNCCDNLHFITNRLITKLMQLNKYSLLEKFISLFSCHLHNYQSARAHFKRQPNVRKRRDKEKREFKKLKNVEDCFDVLNKFHNVVNSQNSREKELSYLRCFIDVLFWNTADESFNKCYEVKQLLSDIVACNVFLPLVDVISDPHWLHKAIILLTSDEDIELLATSAKPDNIPSGMSGPTCRGKENCEKQERIKDTSSTASHGSLINAFPKKTRDTDVINPEVEYCDVIEDHPQVLFSVGDEEDEISSICSSISQDIFINPIEGSYEETSAKAVKEEILSFHSVSPDSSVNLESHVTGSGPEGQIKNSIYQLGDVQNEDFVPKNLFEEIKMVGTETMMEPGGNGIFTLYKIEALSWRRTKTTKCWSLQQTKVKRRYREFLTLQDRLEQHKLYKHSLKGIKGPTRWQIILGKMDKATIDKRQKFLQEYLQKLASKEDISNSLALREFLAYDGDASIAFVRKASDIPRIDQVIAKKVSGVFDKLSSVFDPADNLVKSRSQPNLTNDQGDLCPGDPTKVDNSCSIEDLDIEFTNDTKDSRDFERLVECFLESRDLLLSSWATSDVCEGSQNFALSLLGQPDRSDVITPPEKAGCDDLPLTDALLRLALTSLETHESWVRRQHSVHMFEVVLGSALECWLRSELDDITTDGKVAYYITKLKDTLWPHGELDRTPSETPCQEQVNHTREQAIHCLKAFFPDFLPHVVGCEAFETGVKEIFDCISHPRLNRHFVYQILDCMIQTALPDITNPAFQASLLETDIPHIEHSS